MEYFYKLNGNKLSEPKVFTQVEFYRNSNTMLWSIARGTRVGRCKKHYDSGNHKSVNPAFTQGRDVKKKKEKRKVI